MLDERPDWGVDTVRGRSPRQNFCYQSQILSLKKLFQTVLDRFIFRIVCVFDQFTFKETEQLWCIWRKQSQSK